MLETGAPLPSKPTCIGYAGKQPSRVRAAKVHSRLNDRVSKRATKLNSLDNSDRARELVDACSERSHTISTGTKSIWEGATDVFFSLSLSSSLFRESLSREHIL